MRILISLVLLLFAPLPAIAQDAAASDEPYIPALIRKAGESQLNDFLWQYRPLIVFADSASDPRFIRQMEFITDRPEPLAARDVIVLTDTDPAANNPLRTELRPRGFMLVLIGKDGEKYLRKPFPWDVREITRTIDKLPTRQREMREQQGGS